MLGMPSNRTKEKLLRGETVLGASIGYPDPELVELLGGTGIDYIRIEGEHGPVGYTELEHLVRAAELFDITPMARVPGNLPHEILHFLDRGLVGITVPMIESRADAERAVRAAKAFPIGRRGSNTAGRAARYDADRLSPADYYARLNEQTLLIALIESVDGVKNVAEIAATPGIDAIDIGPNDLAQSMGMPPDAEVDAAVDLVIEAAKRAGKPVGVGNAFDVRRPDRIERYLRAGCQIWMVTASAMFRRGVAEATGTLATALKAVGRGV
jgi:4-hydroxy-2-oxoheptanedioate aldolase